MIMFENIMRRARGCYGRLKKSIGYDSVENKKGESIIGMNPLYVLKKMFFKPLTNEFLVLCCR